MEGDGKGDGEGREEWEREWGGDARRTKGEKSGEGTEELKLKCGEVNKE